MMIEDVIKKSILPLAFMFTKRTIKKAVAVTSVETATEALALSLNERAKVDLTYMAQLTGKTEEKITEELVGVMVAHIVLASGLILGWIKIFLTKS